MKIFHRKPKTDPAPPAPSWTLMKPEQSFADSQRDFETGSAAWRTDSRRDRPEPQDNN